MPPGVGLLIDTAMVPAQERLDFWSESSCDAYHPLQIRSGALDRFWARMWGYELGPLSFFRIGAAPKQALLELRSEPARVRMLADLLERLVESLVAAQQLAERARRNGSR